MENEEKPILPLKTKVFVYLTQLFTTFGARMWWFGIGLFLIEVAPDSLQLTAIYGFSSGGAMLLMAAVVGDWIDRSARLKAARVAMISNNLSVLFCCAMVFIVLTFKSDIEARMEDKRLLHICFAVIVIITIISNLCNLGRTLIMERDWIVEICGRHKDTIATMSATFRAIDLCTKIVAPLITGQIMAFASPRVGAMCIAAWNILSMFIEYFLIWKVYSIIPSLQKEKKHLNLEYKHVSTELEEDIEQQKPNKSDTDEKHHTETDEKHHTETVKIDRKDSTTADQSKNGSKKNFVSGSGKSRDILYTIFSSLISLVRGWRYYMKYDVAISGIALACLYFTVLGFDNITIAYAFTQGMNESILGILFGISAFFGLIASFTYPVIRKRIGLVQTGLLGLSCQISCLSLCMISLGLPGSTFDPVYWSRTKLPENDLTCNSSFGGDVIMPTVDTHDALANMSVFNNSLEISNFEHLINNKNKSAGCYNKTENEYPKEKSKVSLIVLFTGILGARFGVWTADLVIAQLFLENVIETERGIVNGFQSSLNKLMDMLKFIMVILIPDPEMFGYPAMISFCFICTAWLLYARYTKKTLGYLCCK